MSRGALWLDPSAAGRRFGVKGPRAAEWLRQLGMAVPDTANTWAPLTSQVHADPSAVIARLGAAEFFIEEPGEAPSIRALENALPAGSGGVWPVLREDAAFVLGGTHATGALAEVCNVNFAALDARSRPVVMTLMAGVSVLVLPQNVAGTAGAATIYRIWCDPSLGPYLWETLAESTRTSVLRTTTGRAE
jgi:sarcosine oxidase subunit gamma